MEKISSTERKPTTTELKTLLSDHVKAPSQHTPLCVHPPVMDFDFGTSSSTIIEVDSDNNLSSYKFAPGPPCVTEFEELSTPF